MLNLKSIACAVYCAALAAFVVGPHHARASELSYKDVDISELTRWLWVNPKHAIDDANRLIDGLRPTDDADTLHLIGEILTIRCEAHNALMQFAAAKAACGEAIAIFEAEEKNERPGKWHSEDFHIARALSHLATAYAAVGELESALDARLKQRDRTYKSTERPGVLVEVGDLQFLLGQFDQAEASYTDALSALTELRRDDRRMVPLPYHGLATLYRLEERFDKAENALKEGIADTEETQAILTERHAKFGLHEHEISSNVLNFRLFNQSLAWTYLQQGRLDEAQRLATSVHESYKNDGESWSPFLSDVLVLLGRIEDAQEPGTPKAQQLLASAVTRSGGGGYLPNFYRALAQTALAQHHLFAENTTAAEPYARIAVRELSWWVGDGSYHTARAQAVLARVLQHQERNDEALDFAQAAFTTQWAYLPPYHSEIGETLTLMAELYEALGDTRNLRATRAYLDDHKAARKQFESGN